MTPAGNNQTADRPEDCRLMDKRDKPNNGGTTMGRLTPDSTRKLEMFWDAVTAAQAEWNATRDELWPGLDYLTPQARTELGIPEFPQLEEIPDPPLPPEMDPAHPDFVKPFLLHRSQWPDAVRERVEADEKVIAEAEATIEQAHDAALHAWLTEADPEAEI
jgi:hypothetical protein